MQKKQILKGSLTAAATLSMLVACGPSPTQPGASPTPSVSPTATAMPSTDPSATAEPSTEPTATAMPSATASPMPSPTATMDPSASPTPQPSATATDDISVIENTTFNGKVYDEDNTPLSGVTVTVKSLNSSVPYEATASTVSGTYAFNNAPAGVQLEIVASRDGYATRRRVEVLKSNKTGDPNANRYDFGTDGSTSTAFGVEYNALSDKPEVVAVTPARNASGIAPDTTFVLEFSESMDTDTVEENFAIHTSTDEELSVGKSVVGIDSDADETLSGAASLIWDESAFDISWNSDDTQVTFTFQDEQQLPTDTESSNTPDYLVTFSGTVDDGQLKDSSGVTRDAGDEGAFKLTDGNFEFYYEFSIDTDEDEPQVNSVSATVGTNGDSDEVEVEFSEPMAFFTRSGAFIGGNGDDSDSESPLDPNNYSVLILGSGAGTPDDSEVEQNGIQPTNVRFDSDDESNSTVILEFANGSIEPSERVYVYADSDIVDPAGNSIDSSNDIEDDTAN